MAILWTLNSQDRLYYNHRWACVFKMLSCQMREDAKSSRSTHLQRWARAFIMSQRQMRKDAKSSRSTGTHLHRWARAFNMSQRQMREDAKLSRSACLWFQCTVLYTILPSNITKNVLIFSLVYLLLLFTYQFRVPSLRNNTDLADIFYYPSPPPLPTCFCLTGGLYSLNNSNCFSIHMDATIYSPTTSQTPLAPLSHLPPPPPPTLNLTPSRL